MLVGIMTAKGSSSRKIWKVGGLVSVVLGRTPSGLLIYQEGAQGYTEMLGWVPIQIFPGKDTASSLCGEVY